MNSILETIRSQVVGSDDTSFDDELVTHINFAFARLKQLIVGTDYSFRLSDEEDTWDYITDDPTLQSLIIEYVRLKVKMVFDPSASSIVNEVQKAALAELEQTIIVEAERIYKETRNV